MNLDCALFVWTCRDTRACANELGIARLTNTLKSGHKGIGFLKKSVEIFSLKGNADHFVLQTLWVEITRLSDRL